MNNTETIRLSVEETQIFLNELSRPDEAYIQTRDQIFERNDRSMTITAENGGFTVSVPELNLSFLAGQKNVRKNSVELEMEICTDTMQDIGQGFYHFGDSTRIISQREVFDQMEIERSINMLTFENDSAENGSFYPRKISTEKHIDCDEIAQINCAA